MLTDERLQQLSTRSFGGAALSQTELAFARAVEAEARREERERCVQACLAERVDSAGAEDDAYNVAVAHCAAAIRALKEKK